MNNVTVLTPYVRKHVSIVIRHVTAKGHLITHNCSATRRHRLRAVTREPSQRTVSPSLLSKIMAWFPSKKAMGGLGSNSSHNTTRNISSQKMFEANTIGVPPCGSVIPARSCSTASACDSTLSHRREDDCRDSRTSNVKFMDRGLIQRSVYILTSSTNFQKRSC